MPRPLDQPSSERRRRVQTAGLMVIVGLPILVLVIALAQRTWFPTGDQAQAELRMRSLLGNPPLVGAAGRIQDHAMRQGNHPGPLMFWVTWPLYALLGRSAWAFEAATALVNLAWLSISIWLVRRLAGIGACLGFCLVSLVLIGGFGLDVLSQPWNPWVSLFPFSVLVLATWSAIEGDRWAPVLAVAAASYALQGHVGYLPLVVPLCGVALLAPVIHAWRRGADGDGRSRWRWVAPTGVALLVALAAWSGPLVDLVRNEPNNISKLIDNFSDPSDPPIGLERGIDAVFQSINPFGAWVWGGTAVEGSPWPGKILLLVWAVVALLVARRGQHRPLDRLNAVLAATLVVGTIAVSRIFGALYLYTFRWITVLAALLVFTLCWGIATLLPRPSEAGVRRLAGIGVVALILLSLVMSVRLARQDIPYGQSSRSIAGLAPEVADALDPDQSYLLRWDDPIYLGGIGFGLLLELERRGFDVGVSPNNRAAAEPHRVMCPGDYDAVITVTAGDYTIERNRARDDMVEIASTDPRPDLAAWRASYDALLAHKPDLTGEDIERGFTGLLLSGKESQEVVDLATEVIEGGFPSAVFLQDPAPEETLTRGPLTEDCFN